MAGKTGRKKVVRVKQEAQALGRATETDLSQHPMLTRDANALRQMQAPPAMAAPYPQGASVPGAPNPREGTIALIGEQVVLMQKIDQRRRELHSQLSQTDPRGPVAVELSIALASETQSWIRELNRLLEITHPDRKHG